MTASTVRFILILVSYFHKDKPISFLQDVINTNVRLTDSCVPDDKSDPRCMDEDFIWCCKHILFAEQSVTAVSAFTRLLNQTSLTLSFDGD